MKNIFKLIVLFSLGLLSISTTLYAEILTLNCPSISCGSCRAKISDKLSTIEGVEKDSIVVDVEKKTVSFEFKKSKKLSDKDKKTAEETFSKELEAMGYPVKGDVAWGEIKKTQK